MANNVMNLTEKDNETVAKAFPGGEHPFFHQDLEVENVHDAKEWLNKNELVAIVSEKHGGIIGYVHQAHADDVVTVLNLHVIDKEASLI